MKLFLITQTGYDFFSHHAVVAAETPKEALKLTRDRWKESPDKPVVKEIGVAHNATFKGEIE